MAYELKRNIPIRHACVITKDYTIGDLVFNCHCGGQMIECPSFIIHNSSMTTHDFICNKCDKRSAVTIIINDYYAKD